MEWLEWHGMAYLIKYSLDEARHPILVEDSGYGSTAIANISTIWCNSFQQPWHWSEIAKAHGPEDGVHGCCLLINQTAI
jgi:hypothetical protein